LNTNRIQLADSAMIRRLIAGTGMDSVRFGHSWSAGWTSMMKRAECRATIRVAAAVALCASVASCETSPPRDTTDELARAHALIHQAEESGASQYAGADLERARDELQHAEDSSHGGEPVTVQRLASEAAVDAQLASARTSSAKAQHDLGVLQASLEKMRSDEQRQLPPPDAQESPDRERPQ
jgi:Domain of unknown function (DUF4398)